MLTDVLMLVLPLGYLNAASLPVGPLTATLLPALSPAVQCLPDCPPPRTGKLMCPQDTDFPTVGTSLIEGPDRSFQRECLAKSQDMTSSDTPFQNLWAMTDVSCHFIHHLSPTVCNSVAITYLTKECLLSTYYLPGTVGYSGD